jgi:hypothetical protein
VKIGPKENSAGINSRETSSRVENRQRYRRNGKIREACPRRSGAFRNLFGRGGSKNRSEFTFGSTGSGYRSPLEVRAQHIIDDR